jgi:phosphoribosyl 1,2-cyclic phosphodiesterase
LEGDNSMALRFTVLASGSGGNASLIETDDFGLLLDAGLGPRLLADRFAAAGVSWARIRAVLLTHTHSDHWDEGTLTQLWRRQIPLWCHPGHHAILEVSSRAFALLRAAKLVKDYQSGCDLALNPGLRCLPLPVRHDSGVTFGFRFEGVPDLFGDSCALAYAADLGSWDGSLAASLADVDLLALEFNHDVALECASRRSPALIARVLGDEGHLSNEQAAGLVREVLRRSTPGRLQYLVQLHLSRECNRPLLAEEAARAVLRELSVEAEVHSASQDRVSPSLVLGSGKTARRRSRRSAGPRPVRRCSRQSFLPGMESD